MFSIVCCEVVKDFTAEMEMAEDMGEGAVRVSEEKEKVKKRQEAWLSKSEDSTGRSAALWRVHKRARGASYQQLRYVDNQLLFTTGEGLKQYGVNLGEDEEELPHPQTWPRLSMSLDQEGTNICTMMACVRFLALCVGLWWELSHGVWRDIICALKASGQWVTALD